MALFGKKKGADDAPATATTTTTDNGAFDFDAIARDLEASGGSSPLDSLLSQPVGTQKTNAPTQAEESAFDFPGPDAPSMTTPPAPPLEPRAQVTTVVTATPPTSQAAPMPMSTSAPATPDISDKMPLPAPANYEQPMIRPKKSPPIIPLLGALGTLAILGGGAWFFLKSQSAPVDTDTPAPPPRPRAARPKALVKSGEPSSPPVGGPPTGVVTPLRSGSPGIAPPSVAPGARPKLPVIAATNATQTGTATAKGPSATTGLDAALATRLKALWQAGADAKHRGNTKEARDAWQEALRLAPGHPGFPESIAKLPR